MIDMGPPQNTVAAENGNHATLAEHSDAGNTFDLYPSIEGSD
jgi:hypothetical protein